MGPLWLINQLEAHRLKSTVYLPYIITFKLNTPPVVLYFGKRTGSMGLFMPVSPQT